MSITLSMNPLTAGTYNTPPAGWTRPAWSQTTQITTSGGANHFQRLSGTGFQMGAWVNTTAITANTIFASTVHGINATQAGNDSARLCIVNSSGNGYALWLNQAGTTARVYLVAAGTYTTQLVEFTGYGTGYSQKFEIRCTNKSTGTFKFLLNGVQVGSDLVDTTYTGLEYAGCASTGGRVTGMTVGAIVEVTAMTSPVIPGASLTATAVGFGTVNSITGAGMTATSVVDTAGSVTANWPALVEGQVLPVALPAASVAFTFGDGVDTADRNSALGLPAAYNVAVDMGTVITDPDTLGASVTIATGNKIYYPSTYAVVGNITVYPDGDIVTDSIGTFPAILHRWGGDNQLQFLNISRTLAGVGTAPVMPADDTVAADAGDTTLGTYAATSGTAPITYTLTGTDAADFAVNSSTAAVTFVAPAVSGSYSVNVVGTNAYGSDSTALTITVAASAASIDSVGTVRIGGTAAITVSGFIGSVNAGTLDDIALTSASNTSITVPSLVDGQNVPRPGIRALDLTDGSVTGTTNVTVNAPAGWSSYTITGSFVQAVNGAAVAYLPAGWATGDFILYPTSPSAGKATAVSDDGVVTNNVGNQELFLVDAVTGLATAFDIETTAGAAGVGGSSSGGLSVRGLTVTGL